MLDLLATANIHEKMYNAPVNNNLQANAVLLALKALCSLVQDNMTVDSDLGLEFKMAYAATLDNDSDTSIDTYTKCRHQQEKEQEKKEKNKKEKKKRSSSRRRCRRDTNTEDDVNNCPYYKTFKHSEPHPHITYDKCMWNKKYKGDRFKSI